MNQVDELARQTYRSRPMKTILNSPISRLPVPTALERQGDFSQSFTIQLVNGQRVRYPIQV
jgi:hypothetical protein